MTGLVGGPAPVIGWLQPGAGRTGGGGRTAGGRSRTQHLENILSSFSFLRFISYPWLGILWPKASDGRESTIVKAKSIGLPTLCYKHVSD